MKLNNKLTSALKSLNIYSDKLISFLNGKILYLPLKKDEFPWACFPILDDNEVLIDIKLLVPEIIDEDTLLVNIHEFTHAFELFQKLGHKYIENVPYSEKLAKDNEKIYIKLNKKSNY